MKRFVDRQTSRAIRLSTVVFVLGLAAGILRTVVSQSAGLSGSPQPKPTARAEKAVPNEKVDPPPSPTEQKQRLDEANRLLQRAVELIKARKPAEATPLLENMVEIRRKMLGEEHRDLAKSLMILGHHYWQLGERAKVEPLYVQAYGIFRKTGNGRDPECLASRNLLGQMYFEMGEYHNAEPFFIQICDGLKKDRGESDPGYIQSLNELAWVYHFQADYLKAAQLNSQARDLCKKFLKDSDPVYFNSVHDLAMQYRDMGDFAKSEPLFLQACELRKKYLGESHPDYAQALQCTAILYMDMGEFAKAESIYLKSAEIYKKRFGETSYFYAHNLKCLAGVYESMGQYAKAEADELRASEIIKKTLGETHPDYAGCLTCLASLCSAKGDFTKAESLLLQARTIDEKTLGKAHPSYTGNLHNLARIYEAMGDYAKAVPLAKESLALNVRLFDTVSLSMSEAQAREFLTSRGLSCDLLLQLYRRRPAETAEDAYAAVWSTRGLITDWLANKLKMARIDPAAVPVLRKLCVAQGEFSRLVHAPPNPAQREERRKKLAEVNETMENLEIELGKLNRDFQQGRQVRKATPADLAKMIPPRCAVVEMIQTFAWNRALRGKPRQGSWHYEAFVLRRDDSESGYGIHWVDLGEKRRIDLALLAWMNNILGLKTPATETAPERSLRKLLWNPLEPHLTDCKGVYIIPDGWLNFLPWAALPGAIRTRCCWKTMRLPRFPRASSFMRC